MNKVLVLFLSLIALGSIGIGCSVDSIGDNNTNIPILSPQQGQEQTVNSTNDNTNVNANVNNNNNSASSSSDNYVNVQNDNYISNNIYIRSINKIHDISASAENENEIEQGTKVTQLNAQRDSQAFEGNVPLLLASVPTTATPAAAAGGENVGLQDTGLNISSLLMGIIGVMGGLLATRFRSL